MKKTYMNPEIDVVILQIHQQMLSGSVELETKTGNATEWGSREFAYDDYEDEEEY